MSEMTDTISRPVGAARQPHRSRTLAGALALFAGWAGAHRLYLGSRFWWLYPLLALPALGLSLAVGGEHWYRQPGFFVAALVVVVALWEAIVFCLTAHEKWDARHNAGLTPSAPTGWPAVLIAIASLFLSALVAMSAMAIGLEMYFMSMK